MIVDDFKAEGDFGSAGWAPFEANMQRVLPGAQVRRDAGVASDLPLVLRDRTRSSIFPQAYNAGPPSFLRTVRGQRPDQAPADDRQLQHRHLAVLGVVRPGLRPIDDTNEAYKLGVNYIIYGLTH